ncbi:MAG: hypothetical protein HY670_01900 [Chloroflexi bacterium]|nr:hypothetical protein [Chloroflexota bacterium]
MTSLCGWSGTILGINLTDGKIEKVPTSLQFARKYIGGIGFNAVRLFDMTGRGIDALGPENVILFGTGPFTGTLYPGGARLTVTAKSPLTDVFGSTNIGGHFAAELKLAGYDQVAILGKSDRPVYLWIDDDKVELRNKT